MHADIEMNRGEVHRFLEFFRVGIVNRFVFLVEQRAFAITLENVAEIPAVAVVVGELRVLQRGIELGNFFRKFRVAPKPANRGLFGIAIKNFACFRVSRIFLFFRPHRWRVGLVVPHGRAVETIHKHVRLVHVADHALR